MRVSVENTSQLGRRLVVAIPDNTIQEKMRERMKEFRQKASIKGFRQGAVPKEYIEKRFGEQIRKEAVDEAINESFQSALNDESLRPCARPDFKTLKDETGADVEFEASFEVFPEIELVDFSALSVEKPTAEITDADLDKMFENFRDQMADWSTVERASKKGDRVKADVSRLLEGEEEPNKNEGVTIVLDEEVVLEAIAKGLIGKKAEETVELTIDYPEDWNDAAVAGKKATLTVDIKAVEEKHLPSDEALVEKMGEQGEGGIEGIKEKLKEGMTKELERVVFEKQKEDLMELLLEKHQFDLPESLLTQEKKNVEQELERSKEKPEESVEVLADKRVRLGLVLNEVIRTKEIKPDPAMIQAEVQRIARQFGSSPEIIKAYYSNRELMQSVEHSVLLEQSIHAILKEVAEVSRDATYDELVNA